MSGFDLIHKGISHQEFVLYVRCNVQYLSLSYSIVATTCNPLPRSTDILSSVTALALQNRPTFSCMTSTMYFEIPEAVCQISDKRS
jgi:hypothetical protein